MKAIGIVLFCLVISVTLAGTPTCPTNRPYLHAVASSVLSPTSTNLPASLTCVSQCQTSTPGATAGTSALITGSANACKCATGASPILPSSTASTTSPGVQCRAAPGTACTSTTPYAIDGSSCLANAAACTSTANAAVSGNVCACGASYAALPDGSACIATTTGVTNANVVSVSMDGTTSGPYYLCIDGTTYDSTSKTCKLNSVTCPTARPYLYPIEYFVSPISGAPTGLPCVTTCPTGTTATTVSGYTPQVCVCGSSTPYPNLQGSTAYSTAACHAAPSTACTATTPLAIDGSACLANAAACTSISNAAVATAVTGVNSGTSCVCGTGYAALPDGSGCLATSTGITNALATTIQLPSGDSSTIYQCKDGYSYTSSSKTCNASSGSSASAVTVSAIASVAIVLSLLI